MSVSAEAAGTTREAIVIECELAHSPAKVWRALTEPKVLAAWLMPNDIRAEVGHRFTFKAKPTEGWDGTVHAEVLEVEPRRRLRYSWRGGSHDLSGYGHYMDTVVTWTLTPTETGTRLRLQHEGFPGGSFALTAMTDGWRRLVTTCLVGRLAELGAE
ncbi:MAG: SRPBCC domain-containing protein [Alphaproteobacteria bacterium]|nr:SRPBCC domain-containing protein [Alphaproteobacteria bacterium]